MADVDRTLWAGNLSEKVTEKILYELFLQAGPLDKVKIATERDGRQKNFAFITFKHDVSVPFTISLMDGMPLHGRGLRLQSRPGSIHQQQPQQQQQQQQLPPNVQRSNSMNPYQTAVGGQYRSAQPVQPGSMQQMSPSNPYMMNQPTGGGQQGFNQNLHRSNTWHGSDLDSQDTDRGRDRERVPGMHERDRSGRRYDNEDDGRRRDRSSHRNSPNTMHGNYSNNGADDFQAKRQKILRKQDQMIDQYRQNPRSSHHHNHKPWQQDKRRGRY